MVIRTGGVEVFPRLVAAEHRKRFDRQPRSSGLRELDALLGGGLEPGSSALLLGPAGTGKSTFVLQFLTAAIRRGETAAMFLFDEAIGLLFALPRGIGFDLLALRVAGPLHVAHFGIASSWSSLCLSFYILFV